MDRSVTQFRHDLRTPLTHFIGYGELLAETEEGAGLMAVILQARELVNRMQSLPDTTFAAEAREAVHRADLLHALDCLPSLPQDCAADIKKMRHAAQRLAALVDGSAEAADPPVRGAEETPGGSEGALLVVDDNADNRDLLRRMLEGQGYSVAAAEGGTECLELLDRRHFDLVLLDVIMPGLSGFDVLSRMRESDSLRGIPVIVISALDESSAAIRCIQMGAEDYLPKPFDSVLLKARIGASLEKKRLRDRLVVQEKLASLGALTAGIAHELKNPLNFITNFASLAREIAGELRIEMLKPEPDRDEITDLLLTLSENLERVENHGKRADSIVRGMLLHSHGQPGRREPANLNALVEEALNLAYHGKRAHDASFNLRIEKDLAVGLAPVPVASQEISRVIVNILDNAFYSTEAKKRTGGPNYAPSIRVITRDAGAEVEIVLEDNGVGIPPEIATKIFDPFFTTKPAGVGTGLGLSISHDVIVQGHGGTLTVESEPGYARFRILLPKAARA